MSSFFIAYVIIVVEIGCKITTFSERNKEIGSKKYSSLVIVVPDEKCNTGNGNRKLERNNNYICHNDKALK